MSEIERFVNNQSDTTNDCLPYLECDAPVRPVHCFQIAVDDVEHALRDMAEIRGFRQALVIRNAVHVGHGADAVAR